MRRTQFAAAAFALIGVLTAPDAASQVVRYGSEEYKPVAVGFGVTLILADGDSSSADTLPDAATQALATLRDLLPYRSYRLLDTQWTTGFNRAPIRLRGFGDRRYALRLKAGLLLRGKIAVSQCQLWELPPDGASAGAQPDRAAEVATGSLVEPDPTQLLFDSSLGMSVGETVVVGTSPLNDGRALIVLLTARER